ncbi:tRNA (adenosine(37)-N6)-threonylcarbamoyltransferase complex ATPase subunit type 1 TsaE [Candidatus Adlerbacteria bacterium RIFCSPHIGHO2_02_FULL_54_18]|uniref:tRNA threonylcarbamoyladenosine biosynthesis protein TsaE n=2 Tax=Candidatus Adleribacteriota TaxID=1752736 RepID=A0A1F4Y2M3_9BACT|nr:MAG: tRNA (adenosine(37)-N6)-threonylcarbamoyltransferase complex ATPase subunit type 1 TsaE [Candidatus Adlerbacteria bacterium RIFCSPLOWO2_01_FULL_54_21b]OGC88161.1 MAG: tRNA (adenosine(37)-N6)-threonylcarbamoyltransferase complex ATPase subunit type 1 TsaE [Candidatus Adlerbacteria bacterium RIFCSPHIGHO2_02_FULL_54_18]
MQKVRLSDLSQCAKEVLAGLHAKEGAAIVALRGDLGAGKTTFTQALARELGITDIIQSPTYVLMKKYEIKKASPFTTLIHIDAYRLEDPKEFSALNPEQFLQDPKTVVAVEWPERLGSALPAPDLIIRFSSEGAGEGERYVALG